MIEFWISAAKTCRWIGGLGLGWGTWWGKRATNADVRVFNLRWTKDRPGHRTLGKRVTGWLTRDADHHAARAAERRARRNQQQD
jgi:hypothetical protein